MTREHQRRTVAGVPLLIVGPADRTGPLPLVLWFHGFNATADANVAELERIAALGVLAVGVDAVGHGARRFPDFDARLADARPDVLGFMLSLAAATQAELPALVRALADEGTIDAARVAAVGVSMGGYLVYRAAVAEPTMHTVVAILGSPEWPGYSDSPHRHVEALGHVALLSITAEHDASVAPDAARRLHAALPASANARYVELPNAQHLVSGDQWGVVMDETLHWLARHLCG